MKFKFRSKDDDCKSYNEYEITSGNIILPNNNFRNYRYDYHKDYKRSAKLHHPNNLVNTRFQLINNKKEVILKVFANLNWFQRQWLYWVRKDHFLQNNNVLSLLISTIALVLSAIAILKS